MAKSRRLHIGELRRVPPTVVVPDSVYIPPFEHDPIFTRLWVNATTRGHRVHATRIERDQIQSGFYKKQGSDWTLVTNFDDKEGQRVVAKMIRAGRRPPLFVYPSPASGGPPYVCPDDENVIAAYEAVGISVVPVVLLNAGSRPTSRGTVEIRLASAGSKVLGGVVGFSAGRLERVASVELDCATEGEAIDRLAELIASASEALRQFHQPQAEPFHYHHTIYSALHRAHQHLMSMRMLIEHGFRYQAELVLRSLYELYLNVYVDWLHPEDIGPLLQFAAAIDRRAWLDARREVYRKLRSEGLKPADERWLHEADGRGYDLVSKVVEKARLTPLWSLHDQIYGHLSSTVHQDFAVTAESAHVLEAKDSALAQDPTDFQLVEVTALIVAQLYDCVIGDIGTAAAQQ